MHTQTHPVILPVVVNLEDSIAITQNFVSRTNLASVLYFLKHRADQVSGFGSDDVTCESGRNASEVDPKLQGAQGVYEEFLQRLLVQHPDTTRKILEDLAAKSTESASLGFESNLGKASVWHKLATTEDTDSTSFSFDFLV